MVLDVLAVVALGVGVAGGGFVGWRLGVSAQAKVKQVVEDVKSGQLGDAVKDAKADAPKQ